MDDHPVSLRKTIIFRILGGVLVVALVVIALVVGFRQKQRSGNPNTNRSGNTNAAQLRPFDARQGKVPVDTDKDGLTDDEELQLGTNPGQVDTDGDGLSDFDEVKLYHSHPTKVDTDGDGINDGEEVKKGFSPTGPGRLYDTSAAAAKNATP